VSTFTDAVEIVAHDLKIGEDAAEEILAALQRLWQRDIGIDAEKLVRAELAKRRVGEALFNAGVEWAQTDSVEAAEARGREQGLNEALSALWEVSLEQVSFDPFTITSDIKKAISEAIKSLAVKPPTP
jgi:cobalamin biosynthesis protein CbiG